MGILRSLDVSQVLAENVVVLPVAVTLLNLISEIISQQYYAICKRLGLDQVHIPSILKHVGSLTPRRWADS